MMHILLCIFISIRCIFNFYHRSICIIYASSCIYDAYTSMIKIKFFAVILMNLSFPKTVGLHCRKMFWLGLKIYRPSIVKIKVAAYNDDKVTFS